MEGVVDDEEDSSFVADLSDFFNVEDFQSWVGWGFEPDDLGVFVDGGSHVGHGVHVDHIESDVGGWQEALSQVSLGSTVDIVNAQDMVAVLQETEDGLSGRHT